MGTHLNGYFTNKDGKGNRGESKKRGVYMRHYREENKQEYY